MNWTSVPYETQDD